MAHFTVDEANAWLEDTKLDLTSLETSLAQQIATQIRVRFAENFDTTSWNDDATTPALIRSIMSMYYVAWIYDRTYSDNSDDTTSNYAALLRQTAEANILGLLEGTIILPEDPNAGVGAGTPSFFPTDASSDPRIGFHEDPSDGGPAFMMGTVF